MPFAEIEERKLYYEEHGEGQPLLLVAGLGMSQLGWFLQLPAFSQKYRTIVFDNRDVGQSDYMTGPYEVTDMASDALALADQVGIDDFHLLGVSMGGAIAQEIALAAPQRIRTLTIAVSWAYGGRYAQFKSEVWAGRCSA